ncbi:hypothetical protein DFH09DRAFT_1079294 [Mycena vulgaris]|nr:hypothetical protein DFH09DRAFT_1079294 [Mycena vulgaris]
MIVLECFSMNKAQIEVVVLEAVLLTSGEMHVFLYAVGGRLGIPPRAVSPTNQGLTLSYLDDHDSPEFNMNARAFKFEICSMFVLVRPYVQEILRDRQPHAIRQCLVWICGFKFENLLSFVPAIWALWDGEVSAYELESVETQSTTILITAFAIMISAMVGGVGMGCAERLRHLDAGMPGSAEGGETAAAVVRDTRMRSMAGSSGPVKYVRLYDAGTYKRAVVDVRVDRRVKNTVLPLRNGTLPATSTEMMNVGSFHSVFLRCEGWLFYSWWIAGIVAREDYPVKLSRPCCDCSALHTWRVSGVWLKTAGRTAEIEEHVDLSRPAEATPVALDPTTPPDGRPLWVASSAQDSPPFHHSPAYAGRPG